MDFLKNLEFKVHDNIPLISPLSSRDSKCRLPSSLPVPPDVGGPRQGRGGDGRLWSPDTGLSAEPALYRNYWLLCSVIIQILNFVLETET